MATCSMLHARLTRDVRAFHTDRVTAQQPVLYGLPPALLPRDLAPFPDRTDAIAARGTVRDLQPPNAGISDFHVVKTL